MLIHSFIHSFRLPNNYVTLLIYPSS